MASYTILTVDDEPVILNLLEEILSRKGYGVAKAANGVEALEALAKDRFDMVISDIQMPLLDGFHLFARLERDYPHVKRVLMTGCDIDEYMSLVREYNVGNILSKGGDFHLGEITQYIDMLLRGDIFGLDKYFKSGKPNRQVIRSHQESREVCAAITGGYSGADAVFLEIAVNELISNAVFHAVLQMSGVSRELWNDRYSIESNRAIYVSWISDREKIGVSVEDPMGNLRKVDALRWLDHPVSEEMRGDEHGRGLLLVRRLIDRFIINIAPGKRTECILLHYLDRNLAGDRKPLLIHEL